MKKETIIQIIAMLVVAGVIITPAVYLFKMGYETKKNLEFAGVDTTKYKTIRTPVFKPYFIGRGNNEFIFGEYVVGENGCIEFNGRIACGHWTIEDRVYEYEYVRVLRDK